MDSKEPQPDDPNQSTDLSRDDWNAAELERWIQQADQAGFMTTNNRHRMSQHERIPTGTEIDGYQIVSELGVGGRAVVYQAKQIRVAGRDVAMKVYHEMDNETATKDSPPEILALASLNHPHLARIFDAGRTTDGRSYVVMSLLSGVAIDRYCRQESLSPAQIAGLMATTCHAIHELHCNGFIHCDIKPSNIIVEKSGNLTVTDFDSAERIVGRDHHRRGTPGYLAPEQLLPPNLEIEPPACENDQLCDQERSVNPISDGIPADIFSLGATLYKLLTGTVPFSGHSLSGQMVSTLIDAPVVPRDIQPRIPAQLNRICMRCLDRNPERRYATADELANALTQFCHQDSRPLFSLGKSSLVRNSMVLFGCTAALVLLVISVMPFLFSFDSETRPTSATPSLDSRNLAASYALAVASRDDSTLCFLETRDPRPGFMYAKLSPNGQQIAVMGNDHWIRIYEYHSNPSGSMIGDLVAMLPMDRPNDSSERAISWSPDGKRIVACANDNCAILWDAVQHRLITRLKNSGKYNFVRDAQWSPNGKVIATGNDSGLVSLWNEHGIIEHQFQQHQSPVLRVRWSVDGRRIASADQAGRVLIWDSDSLVILASLGTSASALTTSRSTAQDEAIRGLSWHPNGQRLATSNEKGEVFVTDWPAGETKQIAQTESPSHGLLWSQDGEFLVIAGTVLAAYSDRLGFKPIDEPNSEGALGTIQWDVASDRLLVAGRRHQLRSWDLVTGTSQILGDSNVSRVLDFQWSRDGKWLASVGSDGYLRLFDGSGQLATTAAVSSSSSSHDAALAVAWHPDGKRIACGFGNDAGGLTIYEVNAATKNNRDGHSVSLHPIKELSLDTCPQSLDWDRSGDHLLVGDNRGQVKIFRSTDWNQQQQTASLDGAVTDLVVSSNNLVAACDVGGSLKTWHLDPQGQLHLRQQLDFDNGLHALAFDSAGDRLAVSEFRSKVFMLDAETLEEIWPRPATAPARPGKLDWGPDGRQIACGMFGMLDTRDGSLVDASACNQGGCVAWHPAGVIVTGSWEGLLEFRSPPDYRITHRALQLSGGITVALPSSDAPMNLTTPTTAGLIWVSQPEVGRFELMQ